MGGRAIPGHVSICGTRKHIEQVSRSKPTSSAAPWTLFSFLSSVSALTSLHNELKSVELNKPFCHQVAYGFGVLSQQ